VLGGVDKAPRGDGAQKRKKEVFNLAQTSATKGECPNEGGLNLQKKLVATPNDWRSSRDPWDVTLDLRGGKKRGKDRSWGDLIPQGQNGPPLWEREHFGQGYQKFSVVNQLS